MLGTPISTVARCVSMRARISSGVSWVASTMAAPARIGVRKHHMVPAM